MVLSGASILPVSHAASDTASDDVTNYVTRTFNTDLSYSYAHFVVKIDEKSSQWLVLI